MYEVRISNVKANEVNDALNCVVNRLFEGSTGTTSTTFRPNVTAKIVGAEFKTYDNFNGIGSAKGYIITKKDFKNLDGTTVIFKEVAPKCIIGKEVTVTESKLSDINVIQMDIGFSYQSAMLGNTPAMDSSLWDAFMATYFAVRQQTYSYVARTSAGMRWTAVSCAPKEVEMIKNAYIAIGKMYGSRYTIQFASTLKSVDDVIFDNRLFWEDEEDDED